MGRLTDGEWIPAWEEVPEVGEEVTVKIVTGGNVFMHGTGHFDGSKWCVSDWDQGRVVAWTPLPTRTRAASRDQGSGE